MNIESMRIVLEADMKAASENLKQFPRLSNGLTPDSIKATGAYREAKRAHAQAFRLLRNFNAIYKPSSTRN